MRTLLFVLILTLGTTFAQNAGDSDGGSSSTQAIKLPPQSVLVEPSSFAVLGPNAQFRQSGFASLFNPTNTTPPFFQIFDPGFLDILGPNPSIQEIASNATFAFAHEAPVWFPPTDEVFFASSGPGGIGTPGGANNLVGKISIKEVEAAIAQPARPVNVHVTELNLAATIQNTNGGTGPYNGSLLLATSGRGNLPPSLAMVNPRSPNNVTILLDNYFGRQFNSLNDIKVHPSGKIFFTDIFYGFILGFRPTPMMPNQVYSFDPITRAVRVVLSDIDKPNGLAFTPDGKTAYIADSGSLGGNTSEPATIFKFDVDSQTHALTHKRAFAFIDAGIPDGLQLDAAGNVYAGCFDGVQVFNPAGTLLGKFFVGLVSANMVFAGDGKLVILSASKVFFAKIAAKFVPALFP